MSIKKDGIMVILSSPSGAGKTTLVKLLSKNKNFYISVSHTTRKPRLNEIADKDYYFVDHDKFENLIKNEEFLEYAKVFNHLYGTTRTPVIEKLEKSENVIFDIDWQGGQQISNSSLQDDVISFFILPPSIKELELRLHNRAQDSSVVVRDRKKKSKSKIRHWGVYAYVLINDSLALTWKAIKNILCVERMRLSRQPTVVKQVRNLKTD